MDTIPTRFAQISVNASKLAAAQALNPVFSETRFGQTIMVFDGADHAALETLGTLSTPTLSDLFVALMQREGASK
jgi:ABC-2 type transport system ATP-binding protein